MTHTLLVEYWYLFSLVLVGLMVAVYLAVQFALLVRDECGAVAKLWTRERKWAKAAPHYGSVYDASSTTGPKPNVRLVRP
jgi:hypothetical protein